MAPRASSPALSENEFDIADALFGGDEPTPNGKEKVPAADLGLDLDLGGESSDDEAFIAARQAASNRKSSNIKGNSVKKGGGFQAMGLNAPLLKSITKKGFTVPTPIQRKTIPLILDNQDVVGMARTGSGKTAAFCIPLIQKLKAHSAKVGARGIILSPSRELALQTLTVVKALSRGTDLRTILIVGGDSLEEQFSNMTNNPDIIIATPGRFLHLKVEMNLDLSSVQYIVFDEADRLFEMGFATQLAEILHALPTTRQTLLFSATLPKSLVEFARAGLSEPQLVRLDAESKISPDLQCGFFLLKPGERDSALLHTLEKVIQMPFGETEAAKDAREPKSSSSKKRKRGASEGGSAGSPTPHSTIVFAATKHRVEYLASFLKAAGYATSYVYGSLDQTARKIQVQEFRSGLTNILVVTDVAARGLDLPLLANVINYDFPSQPKIFVHRVGRTARAGQKGSAYSFVRQADMPYLVDLQLFLGKKFVFGASSIEEVDLARDVVVGTFPQDQKETYMELANRLVADDVDLAGLQDVAAKGESQYIRTRNPASSASVKRAKELLGSQRLSIHPLLGKVDDNLQKREDMLAVISGFRGQSVFEIGKRSETTDVLADIMRKTRERVQSQKKSAVDDTANAGEPESYDMGDSEDSDGAPDANADSGSESDELEVSISQPASRNTATESWQDSEFFMSYTPKNIDLNAERGYGVQSGGTNFVQESRSAQMDLNNDELSRGFAEPTRARMRWDKKSKNYVARANDDDGSKGKRMIRGESGAKIAASFRSGTFDEWRKKNKIGRMRIGEKESQSATAISNGRPYKHKAEKAPKQADRYRDDYHVQKKRVNEAKEKRIGQFRDGSGKSELKGVDDIRKQRNLQEQRRKKNARPSKKKRF